VFRTGTLLGNILFFDVRGFNGLEISKLARVGKDKRCDMTESRGLVVRWREKFPVCNHPGKPQPWFVAVLL
jgi:hypothetical protein